MVWVLLKISVLSLIAEVLEGLPGWIVSAVEPVGGPDGPGRTETQQNPGTSALMLCRTCVLKVEEQVEQLKVKQAQCEDRAADQHLQQQVRGQHCPL